MSAHAEGVKVCVVLAVLAVLTTGCAAASDDIEEQWKARTSYPTCGDVTLKPDQPLKRQARAELTCMRRALRHGKGAELTITRTTVEGDPVREYYSLSPQGTLQLYVDSTDDRFGARKWTVDHCFTPPWLAHVNCP